MKNILINISRYLLFLVPVIGFAVSFSVTIPEEYNEPVADAIISMLPMIFTIITIALSLPSETIYGVPATTFRKLRKDWHFTFVEMIMITIAIFLFYTISAILKKSLVIWCLDLISIVYSILFVVQEMPILLKNDDRLLKIVKNCWENGGAKVLAYGNESKGKDLYNVIQYLVLNLGVKETYQALKSNDDNSSSNWPLLDFLLTTNNDFMFECANRKDYLSSNHCSQFNNIDILKAIDISFDSLQDSFNFNNNFNVVEIYGDAKHYYQLAKLVLSLKKITDSFSLKEKFDSSLKSLLRFIPWNGRSEEPVHRFQVEFLNVMITYTVSSNELWFLEILKDSEFYGMHTSDSAKPYVVFLSMYYYFLLCINKTVPQKLKDSIKSFFSEKSHGLNSNGENWYDVMQHIFEFSQFNDLVRMLPKLLFYVGNDDWFGKWYSAPFTNSWSSLDGVLDKAFVINCWFALLINSERSYEFDESVFLETINGLSKDEQKLFAYQMNKNWFDDNLFKNDGVFDDYLSIYNLRLGHFLGNYSKAIACICKLKNDINKIVYQEERKDVNPEHLDLVHIKKVILDKFNERKKKATFIDTNLDLTKEKEFYYGIRLGTYCTETLLDAFGDKLGDSFKKIIYDEFKSFPNDNSDLLNDCDKAFEVMKRYQNRDQHLFLLHKFGFSSKQIDELSKINCVDVWLPGYAMWNDGAIRFNIECDKDKTIIRTLNPEEINYIIDNECKVADGLYKFNEGDNKSIFISRDEIYKIISDKYIYAFIVYKYKIDLNAKKILYFPSAKNS